MILTASSLLQAKYLTKKTQAASVEAVKMLDEILLQLCVSAWAGGAAPAAPRAPNSPAVPAELRACGRDAWGV